MTLRTFGEPKEERKFTSNFKKTKFLDLSGTSTVRFLSNSYLSVYTHYVNRVTIMCLGEDCPVCNNNKILRMQFPDTYKEEPKYSPRRIVDLVNVLDKTPVVVCPNCDTDNRATGTCKKCKAIVTGELKPSNTVKVLSKGVTLFDQLDAINNAIRDANGEIVGLTKYDVTLVVSGKTITPIAGTIGEEESVKDEDLYELDKITLKLNPAEILELPRGVSLRDIFAARRSAEATKEFVTDTTQVVSEDILKSVQDDVDKLFGKPE